MPVIQTLKDLVETGDEIDNISGIFSGTLAYLFNVFDYWSYVVTSRPDVKTLKDIEGKNMAAARSTSSFRIFSWFAKQQGVDMSKVEVVNTAPPGLVSYAMADRAAAVQMWSPGYDTTIAKKPELRTLDVKIVETWEKFANSRNIPYLGVAAHTKWVKENTHLVPKLHQAYKDAADWVLANPDEASKLISPKDGEDVQRTIADLIRANDRLGLNVQWASDVQKELELIYKVGIDVDILETMPSTPTFYSGPRE